MKIYILESEQIDTIAQKVILGCNFLNAVIFIWKQLLVSINIKQASIYFK